MSIEIQVWIPESSDPEYPDVGEITNAKPTNFVEGLSHILQPRKRVYLNLSNYVDHDTWREKKITTMPINTKNGNILYKLILDNDSKKIIEFINSLPIDQWYKDSPFVIYALNTKGLGDLLTPMESKKEIKNVFHDRTYIDKETYLKNYKINEFVKSIPYTNYDDNISNENCVVNYVTKTYKKIGKKTIESHFVNQQVTKENIGAFCNKYNIRCILLNAAGVIIYSNKQEHNKNKDYPNFVGIIANNHLYPYISKGSGNPSYKPKLAENIIEKSSLKNAITIKKNGRTYTRDGVVVDNDAKIQKVIDNAFFEKLPPNFSYKSDENLCQALSYNHPDVEKVVYEIDMGRSYYNTARNEIPIDYIYPVFTCVDLWKQYNGEYISDIYYYLISDSSLRKLNDIGIVSNFLMGNVMKFLIDNDRLSQNDIEFYKAPSYTGEWKNVIERLDSISENNPKLPKEFIYYNGLLGKTLSESQMTITGLQTEDMHLLGEDWILDSTLKSEMIEDLPYTRFGTYSKSTSKFRYLNTVNIYNVIVSTASLTVLKKLFEIKKLNPNAKLLRIFVDSLSYDRQVDFSNGEYKNSDNFNPMWKIVSRLDDELTPYHKTHNNERVVPKHIKHHSVARVYHNGKQLMKNINDELKVFQDNKSIQGAPGVGKTHYVQNNLKYDYATTISNVCAINISTADIQAKTLYSLLCLNDIASYYKHFNCFKNKTIWIDEFSMIPTYMYNYFTIMAIVYSTKFIISGDINQIPPVKDKKIDLQNEFFKSIMGDTKILTDKEYSRNDKGIIELRDSILSSSSFHIEKCTDDFTIYDRHICYTNATKDNINAVILQTRGYTYNVKQKNVKISNGVILRAVKSVKESGILKNDIWKVLSSSKHQFTCRNLIRKFDKVFSHDEMRNFGLGFAITTHSAQGLTIDDDLCIHEIDWMLKSDRSILYTAVTRAKSINKLHFYPYYNKVEIEPVEEPYEERDFESSFDKISSH